MISAGASGIGYAMAKAFKDDGYQIYIGDKDENAIAACKKDGFHATILDISQEESVKAWVQNVEKDIEKQGGIIDAYCMNAGIAGPTASLEHIDLQAWHDCLAVNLAGAFLMTKYATPYLKARRQGALIYVSSTAGSFGYPNRAPYCASKWGINGLMKTAAMELGAFNIRANSIAPGGVTGPRFEGVMTREAKAKHTTRDEIYAGYVAGVSLQTLIDPEDIAAMAVFLASPAAQKISGQIIAVDGHTVNPDPQ